MTHAEAQSRWIKTKKGEAYLKSDACKQSIRKYNKVRDRKYRDVTQSKVRRIKLDRGCIQCGFKAHHATLEFHHRDPKEKKFRLSESRNYSWKAVLLEIEKCDVMCSNCHSILEYNKRYQSNAELVEAAVCKTALSEFESHSAVQEEIGVVRKGSPR